jgi:cytochrome bd-type quinol oxidase subunit 2
MQTTFWLAVLGLFLAGYLAMEGADFGAGMLLPLFGRDDQQGRDTVVRAIAPLFLGNEVWLVAAIGVVEGAFPRLNAPLLPRLYPALILILVAWLIRDAALWFRSQGTATWRWHCDQATALASTALAGGWGVVLANMALSGTALSDKGTNTPVFGLAPTLSGILLAGFCALHGTLFLSRRVPSHPATRIRRTTRTLAPLVAAMILLTGAAATMTAPPGHHWPLWLLGAILLTATTTTFLSTQPTARTSSHPTNHGPANAASANPANIRVATGLATPTPASPRPTDPNPATGLVDPAPGATAAIPARDPVTAKTNSHFTMHPDPRSIAEPPEREAPGNRRVPHPTLAHSAAHQRADPGIPQLPDASNHRLHTAALLLTSLALIAAVPLAVLPDFPHLPTGLTLAAASGSATLGVLTPLLLAVSPILMACQAALWWLTRGPVDARSWSYF